DRSAYRLEGHPMAYTIRDLMADTAKAVGATRGDDDARCAAITPHLQRWMDGGEALPDAYVVPCNGGACGHLLYTDPEGEFFAISVVFPPGTSSGVHYHGAWGVIGILAGTDEETKYRRESSPDDVGA